MALPHAAPLDIINVSPLGEHLREAVSTSLIKTRRMQLLHMVLPAQESHSLRARTDCAVLVTLLLRDGDAGNGGGAGNLSGAQ